MATGTIIFFHNWNRPRRLRICYFRTGPNVLRTSAVSAADVGGVLGAAIADRFGFEVPVVVLSRAELEDLYRGNPFVGEDLAPAALHVTVLARPPSAERARAVDWGRFGPERGALAGRWLYGTGTK